MAYRFLLILLILWATTASAQTHRWNVAEAGAIGDGAMDCTAIFQQQLDACGAAGGGVVEVPAGRYRINGTLSIPANVTLQGVYRVPPTIQRDRSGAISGSVLLAYAGRGKPDGPPFIRLAGNNSSIAGLVIIYPEWNQKDVPPIPYPPCIFSTGTENVGVRDCLLLNPYEGIKFVLAHRHIVRNVTGYPIKRGIYVDECYDIGHIENVHFWPFGVLYDPNDPYCKWINLNGTAFELARTDWHYVFNTFCFGYGIGYYFSQSKAGGTNGNFLGIGADSCQRAVVVDQAQPPGILITNGEFVGRWSSTDSVCFEVGPKMEGKVSLVNCSFWGPIERCVWMRAPAGQFTASACNFVHWDAGGKGAPAIDIAAGRAIIQASTFMQEGTQIQVAAGVRSALIHANQAIGGLNVRNAAGARTVMTGNQVASRIWTSRARDHYQLFVGQSGDQSFLRGFHGQERLPEQGKVATFRWTTGNAEMVLPVNRGKAYTLEVSLVVPQHALTRDSGLYLGGRLVAPISREGTQTLRAAIPPQAADRVVVGIRCQGWQPIKHNPGSQDPRTLGVQFRRVMMRAAGADPKSTPFRANADD